VLSPTEEIDFNRICVSKPLPALGRYASYRIIELSASNNEGVAAFAALFAPASMGHDYPVLMMTDRKYFRYGSTLQVQGIETIFAPDYSQDESVRIGVYPTRFR
jgi:hypothetical protein